jgi:hypothetical protein
LKEVSAVAQRVPRPSTRRCRVGVGGHAGCHALRAFQNLRRAGEAILRQIGRHQPCRCRVGRVQLLGICRCAQKLPQPRRLGARRAEGVLHLLRVQAQQMAHGGGRRQRARGAGGVEHLVVRPPQKFPDPDANLIAGDCRRQKLFATGAECLGHSQSWWKHHRGRVKHRTVVHIVLLGHMRCGGVGHGGEVGAALGPMDQYFGRARTSRSHGGGKAG